MPTALAVWAVTFVDRLLLQHLGLAQPGGEYAMANRVCLGPPPGRDRIWIAFSPFALDLRTRDPEHERAVRAQALTAVVAVLAVLGSRLSVFAREL